MPYISKDKRDALQYRPPRDVGELAYVLTHLCQTFIQERNFASYSQVMGVLECVKLEFYRKVLSPYEEEKCQEHGDVFQ